MAITAASMIGPMQVVGRVLMMKKVSLMVMEIDGIQTNMETDLTCGTTCRLHEKEHFNKYF